MIMHISAMLDYWQPRADRGESREAEEQAEYYNMMMKYLVTEMDTVERWPMQNGPNLVFPCN